MSSIFKVSILLKEIGRDGAKMARFRDLRVLKKLRAILDDFSSMSHYVLIKMHLDMSGISWFFWSADQNRFLRAGRRDIIHYVNGAPE